MRILSNFFILVFVLLLIACGGKNEQQTSEKATESKSMKSDVFEVEITANDQMMYNVKTIEVPAGSTVKVNFKHIGQMPKETMGHNFIILKPGVDMAQFAGVAEIRTPAFGKALRAFE